MSDQELMVVSMFLAIVAVLGGLAFWRLRRWSTARADAERRAAAALEEMERLAHELREKRTGSQPVVQ